MHGACKAYPLVLVCGLCISYEPDGSSLHHGAPSSIEIRGHIVCACRPIYCCCCFRGGILLLRLGGLVYLRFESDLRIAVDQVRLATLSTVQARFSELFSNQGALSAKEWVQLGRLKDTADYLSKSGHLRGSLQSLGVVVAAILPPLVSMVGSVLTYVKKPR